MKYHLIALGWLGLSVSTFAAQTATQPLPTLTAGDVKPNIMFTIDDSGSMAWSHMPDTVGSWIYKVGYHNALCNGVYYNPNTLYLAPKNADGSNMPNASYTAAWYDGYDTNNYGGPDDSRTYDLSNSFFAYDDLTGGAWAPQQTAFYWTYNAAGTPSDAQCKVSLPQSTDTLNTGSWTKTKIPNDGSAASVAARQNFANWFSYYRTRMLMMKSSAGLAFSAMDSSYRIGFSRIGRLSGKNYKSSGFLNIDNFDGTQKSAWYDLLYSVSPGGGTPLKKALSAVGEIYSGVIPGGVVDPIQYSCQQNFEILTTDGYWNANGDGVSVGNQDGSDIPRPMFDGAGQENNLADVAMKYFKHDLRTTGPYSTNNVPNSPAFPLATSGNAGRQMMRTYTLGLGMEGTLNYTPDYETNTDTAVNDFIGLKNGTKNWPTIIGDKLSTIDDLWHAAVNGGGKFFSAKDPNAVAASLQSALNDISGMMASVSAADVSNEFMTAADNKAYNSRYKTQEWTGDVLAKVVDVTSTSYLATDLWSAQALLAGRAASTRVIYSCTGSCTSFTNFDATTYATHTAIAAGVTSLKTANSLNSTQQNAIDGTKLVNYLRGDQSNEPTTASPSLSATTALFRQRTKTLGAIIHGGNQYIKASDKAYADAGYSTFSRANLTRRAMVYAPANDGMLHAFDATTGAELWAFIPPSLLPRLWKQADRSFGSNFQYFVDGRPTITDVQIGSDWKTILIGGLRGGGGEYYAIDITDPASPAPLWSFKDSKLGQTYGLPVVGKIGRDWKVLLSSGYDNSDNKGYVFVLNAGTGVLEKTFPTTCTATDGSCGISKIGVLMEEANVDDTIKMAYAGDLAGNLWRFDVTKPQGDAILVAKTGTASLRQPISSAPLITEMPEYKNSGGIAAHYVTFGTGRFLHQSDMTNRDQQTIYGLFVDPSLSSIDNSFTALSTSSSLITLDISSGVDKVTLTRAADTALDNNLATCKNSTKGWRADLPITMERIPNDPRSFNGDTAIYTSVIPKADSCTPGGVSRTYNMPRYLTKNWLCSNPSAEKYVVIGSNINEDLSDDAGRPPSVNTPNAPSGTLTNKSEFKAKDRDKIQGRRSSWTEIIR